MKITIDDSDRLKLLKKIFNKYEFYNFIFFYNR